jgi:trans-aconitate 2-methyltransferase
VDIGCGPGNSTFILREKYPTAEITGVDSSKEMIESARKADPDEKWIVVDIREWKPDIKFDIVFSNAVLQWLPDHEILINNLFEIVNSKGVLAVQVPANFDSPLHKALVKVSESPEWNERMEGCSEALNYNTPEYYYDLLSGISQKFSVWQTIYYHVLENHNGLIEWYSSTGMKHYLERISDDREKAKFKSQVLEGCRESYSFQKNNKILLPFRRTFFTAYKG